MIVLKDDNFNVKSTPFVTYALIIINTVIYLLCMNNSIEVGASYAILPAEIVSGKDIVIDGFFGKSPQPVFLTIFSSMFLHNGFLHLLGNMLFLFVFGNNLEDAIGRLRFLCYYLICGVAAAIIHVGMIYLSDQNPYILCLGASGAISGVVGGYLYLFPRNKVYLLFLGVLLPIRSLFWGFMWLVMQIIGSLSVLSKNNLNTGIAYFAHLGGFFFGILLLIPFAKKIKSLQSTSTVSP